MKRIYTIIAAAMAGTAAMAQTLNVHTGSVCTAVQASDSHMAYAQQGTTLTVEGKTFSVNEIDSLVTNLNAVTPGSVTVTYANGTAQVVIAGNIARYVTANVSGANVCLLQDAALPEEITYTLQGEADNGSFYMDGELKATIVLNNLTLTSQDSAAINIQNGKRIKIVLPDGTTSTLADGAEGSQKACLFVNGHPEIEGGGTLNVTGNAKHAIATDEYMRMKASTGSVNILKAKKDGLNISQYLKMEGGTLNVSNIGDDAVQVSLTDDSTDEDNGQVMISGGTVTLDVTATAAKGIKSDGPITISGGTITITTSGGGEYDSEEMDTDASSAIKSDSLITINGGMITLKSTGAGGKGISSDTDIVINGGTINVTTTGQKYVYGAYDSSPKGMKADNNLTIMGGDICVTATGGEGSEGIESKNVMTLGGGDIVINTYDDAINATNKIIISDGRIYANSTRNDAIDSNGTIDVTGGLVIACGTTAPEGGFDCDQNTFTITGGTLIGLGGSTSTPSSQTCTQPVIVLGGKQLQQDAVIELAESDGSCLFTFTVPQQLGQATMLLSCPGMSVGNTYTISSGATLATDSEPWQGYTSGGTSTGATTMASLTLTQTVTTSGNTGGGPGGGGPGGGGGRP